MTPSTAPVAQHTPQQLTDILMKPNTAQHDMIAGCRRCLVEYNIPPAQLAIFDNDSTLNAVKGMSDYVQRVALNQFWHLQMGPFGGLSQAQRFKLIDTGTIEDWFKFFNQGPVQFIIDNNLPVLY